MVHAGKRIMSVGKQLDGRSTDDTVIDRSLPGDREDHVVKVANKETLKISTHGSGSDERIDVAIERRALLAL